MQGGTSQISRRSSKVSLSHFSLAGISLLPSILGDFLVIFFKRFGTKRVKANDVYQEYIQDKNHLHMNATRWVTLTEFIKYLGRAGIAHVDETDKCWFIAWIDRSSKALEKQEASLKKERATTSSRSSVNAYSSPSRSNGQSERPGRKEKARLRRV